MNTLDLQAPILIYPQAGGGGTTEVRLEGDTVWLTQKQMAELFATTPENVLMHLKNVYQEGELQEPATAKDFLVVRQEGKRQVKRQLKHYNLDAIISVGYWVNSSQATRFRQWATRVLRDHLNCISAARPASCLPATGARGWRLACTWFYCQLGHPADKNTARRLYE